MWPRTNAASLALQHQLQHPKADLPRSGCVAPSTPSSNKDGYPTDAAMHLGHTKRPQCSVMTKATFISSLLRRKSNYMDMRSTTPMQMACLSMIDTRCWRTLGISRWSHSCCSFFSNKFVQCPPHLWIPNKADHREDPHSSTCRPWLHTTPLFWARDRGLQSTPPSHQQLMLYTIGP